MIRIQNREEANAFWLDMIKGFGNEASEIKIVFM
jgi:hypothetical protein